MGADYRQKLLDWLLSMMILVLVTSTGMAAFWFFNGPYEIIRTFSYGDPEPSFALSLVDYASPMGEGISLFASGTILALIWHSADFAQIEKPLGRVWRIAASAGTFHVTLLAVGICLTVEATGWFSYTALCGSAFQFLSQACYMTKDVLLIPRTTLLCFLLFLCMGKAVISIRSHLKKAP